MKHVDTKNILTDSQHGPIGDADPTFSLASGKQTDMVVLDFSKAFDRIPQQRLMRKLHHYAIIGSIHHWISSFLSGHRTTEQVVVVGCSSSSDRGPSRVSLWNVAVLVFFYQRPARQDHFKYKTSPIIIY